METPDHGDAEDTAGDSADKLPPLPAEDDDTPAGDTDQHSDADA
jgi:hypothetical protein